MFKRKSGKRPVDQGLGFRESALEPPKSQNLYVKPTRRVTAAVPDRFSQSRSHVGLQVS